MEIYSQVQECIEEVMKRNNLTASQVKALAITN
jgi:glycerol kinase